MDLGLTGKVALVCGASSGLGEAVAVALAAEGAHLSICARRQGELERVRDAIAASGGRPPVVTVGDLAAERDVDAVARAALAAWGRVDVLVNNTGGPPAGAFDELDAAAWRRAADLLLMSVVEMTRRLLPGMKERRWGRVITITSMAVKQPLDGLMLSNSLRAAVTGFTRTLANEVAPFGVTVNNVLPGYTRTARLDDLARGTAKRRGVETSEVFTKWESDVPMKRLGRPEELAALVAFLASERASYITGTSVPVDGGWTRGLF
jgi:3-oxoacyl-[acyl-carrier protein] reductase